MCKTLEDIASTLFKSWFIDFDPVKAKSEGRIPEGLSPEIAALFPDSFVNSALGLIPSGWQIKKLGDVSQIDNGYAFKSEDYRENGVYILRTKNFSDEGYVVRLKDDVFLNINLLDKYKNFLCKPFDYHLVMVGNSIGKTAYILPHLLPALRNQNMWCFRPKIESRSRFYLNLTIDQKVKSVMGWASGSARSFFRKSDFQIFDILWPSDEIQIAFEDVTIKLYEKIANLNQQMDILTKQRDLLLPKLVNGTLKVSEAEMLVLLT
jgi:type I restriction enzyme S subunit